MMVAILAMLAFSAFCALMIWIVWDEIAYLPLVRESDVAFMLAEGWQVAPDDDDVLLSPWGERYVIVEDDWR